MHLQLLTVCVLVVQVFLQTTVMSPSLFGSKYNKQLHENGQLLQAFNIPGPNIRHVWDPYVLVSVIQNHKINEGWERHGYTIYKP